MPKQALPVRFCCPRLFRCQLAACPSTPPRRKVARQGAHPREARQALLKLLRGPLRSPPHCDAVDYLSRVSRSTRALADMSPRRNGAVRIKPGGGLYEAALTSSAANLRRRWSENFSPSLRSVRTPLTFHGLHILQPARQFLALRRLKCAMASNQKTPEHLCRAQILTFRFGVLCTPRSVKPSSRKASQAHSTRSVGCRDRQGSACARADPGCTRPDRP
jgi:hypothetical protein